ncbi:MULTISPECIES: hypothetical protein [Photorhabdus]|uniref:Uncharacterized protein n=2 Tax=Photorhabdus TaxID=29487 RepID=A0AAW6BRQ6_9GAMM|nr:MULTISPECIES: hypothetical protein [Photorhabdus]EYU16612.1 hypothetical protein BA1DRAFT_00896 [Photorhabdus aegyptia]MDB6374662.1 hypothetical protein [Photorhabdus bodei]
MNFEKELAAHNLVHFGWQLEEFNHTLLNESHVVYFRDFKNVSERVVTLNKASFSDSAIRTTTKMDHLVSVITNSIKIWKARVLHPRENAVFTDALTQYIKNIITYRLFVQAAEPDERFHMIINIYGTKKRHEVNIRPVIARSESLILTHREFRNFSENVFIHDRTHNPRWFK